MSFEYYSETEDDSIVHSDRDEIINGIKTFNHNINTREIIITDTDNHKTVIRNNIDPGEFKVTKPDSNNGFIIRTNSSNTSNNIQQLEMLSTNGTNSYTYKFPFKDGTVALTDDLTGKLDKTEASSTYTTKTNYNSLVNRVGSIESIVDSLSSSSGGITDLGENPNLDSITTSGIYKGITRNTEASWSNSYNSFILIVTNDQSTTDWVNNYIETNKPYGFSNGWLKTGVIQTIITTTNTPTTDSAAYWTPSGCIVTRNGYIDGSTIKWYDWRYIKTSERLVTQSSTSIRNWFYPGDVYQFGVVNSIKFDSLGYFSKDKTTDNSNNYEYKIYFTAGDNCSLTLHKDIMLVNGEIPVIESGVQYEISVLVTTYTLDNTIKTDYKMTIVPFKKVTT